MTTLAVRNNNMGNLKDGSGNFQSFSDPVEGKAALYNDLTAKMTGTSKTGLNGDSSLLDFAKTYAPASDKNDPIQYAADIANKMGISPDTKIGTLSPRIDDFASAVASNEDPSATYKATNQTNTSPDTQNSTPTTPQTFEDYLKQNPGGVPTPPGSNPDLQAGNPTTPGNTGIGNAIANFIPGTKMAQGLGYGLAAATGSQKGLIDANNQGMDIQGQLLAQIKKDKAKGKDTSKLEKAMKDLGLSLTDQASQISDVGTGGISNKDVLSSAGALATLPAAGYLGAVLGGGGVMGTESGLTSFGGGEGFLGSSSALSKEAQAALKVMQNPVVKNAFTNYFPEVGNGTLNETLANAENLTNTQKFDALSNALKEETVASKKGILQKAIDVIKPLYEKENGIVNEIPKNMSSKVGGLIKSGISMAGKVALVNSLGSTAGNLIHGFITK